MTVAEAIPVVNMMVLSGPRLEGSISYCSCMRVEYHVVEAKPIRKPLCDAPCVKIEEWNSTAAIN
jgi:hypothetical protein